MIQFRVDWSQPLNWIIAGALLLLLGLQLRLLFRSPAPSAGRRTIRVVLNGLLWLMLAGYVLQPVWQSTSPTTHALLVSDDVPAEKVRAVQAGLGRSERFTPRNFTGDFARVTLLGQAFPAPLLSRLSASAVQWIPYPQPDQVQTIHWKALVRQGEMQRVSGVMQSSRPQWLKLRYAGLTLDSTKVGVGNQAFTLQFPAFTRGRTQVELSLVGNPPGRPEARTPAGAGTLPDTIRFFARRAGPMAFQFILDNPDFETKTLADWLGRMGQAVQLTSTVSTSVRNSLIINETKGRKADMVITDPGNAANPVVKRAMLDGKRVLFINLTNPDADLRTINQALGTRFAARTVSNVESVSLANGLTALPFQFSPLLSQQTVPGYPVAVQRTNGLVGVSLLNETFPLVLSGDSLAYARLWYTLLAPFQPPGRSNVLIDAPLFGGLRSPIRVNNAVGRTALIRVAGDTARLSPSPINPLSAEGVYRFNRLGWVPVADSLAVFVQPLQGSAVGQNQLVGAYVLAHQTRSTGSRVAARPAETRITEWVWFALFIGCCTALWVEPKLG